MLDPAQFTLSTIDKVRFSPFWTKSVMAGWQELCLRAGSDDISSAFHKIRCRFDGGQCGRMADSWWAWPDGCCSIFLQSKTNFVISTSNACPAKWQQCYWCFYGNKMFWSMWFKSQKPAGLVLLQWCHLVSYNCSRQQSDKDAKAHASASRVWLITGF